MIVTAMLAWYDEPAEELAACVAGLAVVADRVLAVDGGYRLTPGAEPASPPEQAAAIRDAADRAGLDHAVIAPDLLWEGQVAKRDFMIRAAAPDSDWVLPVDADWRLYGDRRLVRRELERCTRLSVAVDFFTPPPLLADTVAELAPHEWHAQTAGTVHQLQLLYRPGSDPRVEDHHWWYSGVHGSRRYWLWDGDSRYRKARFHRLAAPFLVEHRCFFRRREQLERNRVFCAARDAEVAANGVES